MLTKGTGWGKEKRAKPKAESRPRKKRPLMASFVVGTIWFFCSRRGNSERGGPARRMAATAAKAKTQQVHPPKSQTLRFWVLILGFQV